METRYIHLPTKETYYSFGQSEFTSLNNDKYKAPRHIVLSSEEWRQVLPAAILLEGNICYINYRSDSELVNYSSIDEKYGYIISKKHGFPLDEKKITELYWNPSDIPLEKPSEQKNIDFWQEYDLLQNKMKELIKKHL